MTNKLKISRHNPYHPFCTLKVLTSLKKNNMSRTQIDKMIMKAKIKSMLKYLSH